MLATLKSYSPGDRETLLVSTSQHFLPQPFAEDVELSEAEKALLEEIRTQLELDAGDNSSGSQTQILQTLHTEMSAPLREHPERAEAARARLGHLGILPERLYRIRFGDQFRESEKFGIRRSHVEEAIGHPDHAQHILPESIRSGEHPAVSLFTKTVQGQRSYDTFTLLVTATRENAVQRVDLAWRVYHSDVTISQAYEPLNVLRAFVEKYGIECRVGSSAPAKFFCYEAFPLLPSQRAMNPITSISSTEKGLASFLYRVSPLGVLEVALAYTIDLTQYGDDLRQHNVQMTA